MFIDQHLLRESLTGLRRGAEIKVVNDIRNKFSILSIKEGDKIIANVILPKSDGEIRKIIEQAERDLLKSSYGKG